MTYCAECGRACEFPWHYADMKTSNDFVDITEGRVERVKLVGVSKQLYFCTTEHRQTYFETNYPELMD